MSFFINIDDEELFDSYIILRFEELSLRKEAIIIPLSIFNTLMVETVLA